MMSYRVSIFLFTILYFVSFEINYKIKQHLSACSLTYIGAVVEYESISSVVTDHQEYLDLTIAKHLKFVEKAVEKNVDILVFPETSLSKILNKPYTSPIPEPNEKIVPCYDLKYAPTLRNISCVARKYKLYIVVNHHESSGSKIFNTNAVFDRNGQVIAKYRKYNLFLEPNVKSTQEPDLSTFTTDFGVTFGQFTCFDLLFPTPALNLTRNLNVTDIIFPAHWYSELPFLTSTESQAAWAYSNDVNLLASGFNNVSTGSGGSGIYLGKQGPLVTFLSKNPANVLIVAEVPKIVNGKRVLGRNSLKMNIYEVDPVENVLSNKTYSFEYSDGLTSYSSKLIDLVENDQNTKFCSGKFCCNFEVKLEILNVTSESDNYYRYRYVVFDGVRKLGNGALTGIKVCGVITCVNDTLSSCSSLYENKKNALEKINFKFINISAPADFGKNVNVMPVTYTKEFKPLNIESFSLEKKDSTLQLKLTFPVKGLIAFAIYGRNFDLDSPRKSHSI